MLRGRGAEQKWLPGETGKLTVSWRPQRVWENAGVLSHALENTLSQYTVGSSEQAF